MNKLSWKIRPKSKGGKKQVNTFLQPPCVGGIQSSLIFLSLGLVNSHIDCEMKNYRAELLTLGLKMLGWRSAIIRNRKWKTKQNTENVPDLKCFDGWNEATNRRRIIDCPDRRNADIEYIGTKCFLPFLCKVETSRWPMWIVPSFIAACISNNTSLPEWKPNGAIM